MDWTGLLNFLRARSIAGVEAVECEVYSRFARFTNGSGAFVARNIPEKSAIEVTYDEGLAPANQELEVRCRRLFDLDADPIAIADTLGELGAQRPGLRVPGAFDGFELAARAILGQQISVAAARTLAGRIAAAFGEPGPVSDSDGGKPSRSFPSPSSIVDAGQEAICACGLVGKRAFALVELARQVRDGNVVLQPSSAPEEVIQTLIGLPGIGDWTAHYIAMRVLRYADAFPHRDLGLMKALGETRPKYVLERAEAWRPYRAYAALALWASLT